MERDRLPEDNLENRMKGDFLFWKGKTKGARDHPKQTNPRVCQGPPPFCYPFIRLANEDQR